MRIHHLAFRTRDLARLEDFYGRVLGLRVTKRDAERSVWLDAGGAIVMLERCEPDKHEPAIDRASLELTCFALEPSDFAAITKRLDDAGVAVEAETAFTIYLRDPDGRRVGLSSFPQPRGT